MDGRLLIEYLFITGSVIIILFLIFMFYISCKKYILEIFPNENVNSFKQNLIQLLINIRWDVEVKKEHLHIEFSYFSAVNLYFIQNGQNVEVYYILSATLIDWILMILGIFTFSIMTIITALFSVNKSNSFTKNMVYPLLIKIKKEGFKDINYDDLLVFLKTTKQGPPTIKH